MRPRLYLKSSVEIARAPPRPFEDIPGPRSLPLFGTLYKYLPYVGEYSFERLHATGAKKLAKYGPLVREEIVPGVFTVWLFRPEDIARLFKAEVYTHPERRSHLALLKYRNDRKEIYNTGGLLPTNGPEWWKIRKEFQKGLSKPRSIVDYVERTDEIIDAFFQLIEREKSDSDVLPLLSRLFLELTCLVAFGRRFDSFSAREMEPDSTSSRLIDAAFETNSAVLALDNGPRLWRFFDTPLYKKFSKSQRYMEQVALDQLSRSSHVQGGSLLETCLANPNLDEKDVLGMACDMLLAGIDTTTYSLSFALHHLGRGPEAQEKLSQEATRLLPNPGDPVTPQVLKAASYTKAALKETFRLNPISVGIGRLLKTDAVFSGYRVPAGTVAVTQNQVICRLAEHFDEPESYRPERWCRVPEENQEEIGVEKPPIDPYLVLPFGHGTRSCIARRLAEQNIFIFLLKMCRRYKFTWIGDRLDSRSLLINKPDGPIKLDIRRR